MPNENVKKRLLYDLSPIPRPPVNEGATGKLDPEVRVVYKPNVLRESRIVTKSYVVGSSTDPKKVDLMFDESAFSEDSFELVSVVGDQMTLNLKEGFKGYVVEKKERKDLSSVLGKKSYEIGADNFAVLEFGDISIVALKTPHERLKPAGLIENREMSSLLIMLVTFIIGFFIMNMIVETPPIEVDIFEIDNRFANMIVGNQDDVQVEDIEKEKKVKLEKPKEGLVEATQQRKSLGEEGRVGDKKSRVANAQGSARRGLDEKVAQSSGVMGALSSGAASFDRIFGGGGLGAGMEKTLGSVTGISGVDQFGSGGLGTRGFGTGGGGNALGIGGLGTRGRGGGGMGGMGYGMAAGRIGGKGLSAITAGGGQAVIMGALDRAVIDAYIKRNLAKIRWCYEKELNKDPKLFGKIVINFIISKTGQVSSSKVQRSTMGNENVESCVADQIKKIRFPAPKGGGIVIVNYPFVFKHSEG